MFALDQFADVLISLMPTLCTHGTVVLGLAQPSLPCCDGSLGLITALGFVNMT